MIQQNDKLFKYLYHGCATEFVKFASGLIRLVRLGGDFSNW